MKNNKKLFALLFISFFNISGMENESMNETPPSDKGGLLRYIEKTLYPQDYVCPDDDYNNRRYKNFNNSLHTKTSEQLRQEDFLADLKRIKERTDALYGQLAANLQAGDFKALAKIFECNKHLPHPIEVLKSILLKEQQEIGESIGNAFSAQPESEEPTSSNLTQLVHQCKEDPELTATLLAAIEKKKRQQELKRSPQKKQQQKKKAGNQHHNQ